MSTNASEGPDPQIKVYLSGQMDEQAAADFEERVFENDELAAELEQSLELAVALGPSKSPSLHARPVILGLAATLAAAAVGIGIWLNGGWQRETPVSSNDTGAPSVRGHSSTLELRVGRSNGAFTLTWEAVRAADRYVIEQYSAGRALVRESETSDAALVLNEPLLSGSAVEVRVLALDKVGQVVLASDFHTLE